MAHTSSPLADVFDVVVVGSGFGGAVTACRLAQAGHSVCVLERGKRWLKGEFPSGPLDLLRRAFWNERKSYGYLDYRTFDGIEIIQGCGVGGGSLHYFNVGRRASEDVIFSTGRWPRAIGHGVLDPYYALAEEMLQSRPLTPPPGFDVPQRTRAFFEAVSAAGAAPERVPLNVKFRAGAAPTELPTQQTCDYRGECLTGCNRHAKHTVDLNYLRLAEEKHGASVRPLCVVDNLEPLDEGGFCVHGRQLDPHAPGRSAPCRIFGRRVVLAAGSLGSTELLLRCRDAHRSLPHLSPMLGRAFSTNGDYLLAGALMPKRLNPMRGPSITAGADFSTRRHVIFIEDLGVSPALEAILRMTVRRRLRVFNCLRKIAAWRAGNDFELPRPVERVAHPPGDADRFLPFLAMGLDAGDGEMRLDDGRLNVLWNAAGSADLFREMRTAMKRISRSAGGQFRETLWLQTAPGRLLTAHPLGGCVMGDSPDRGVVDHVGRVWGYPDLYVADGAIVPSALAVNPSLTIAALAERVAFWMIHGREMRPGDDQTPPNS